jgi:hypothetical protein
MEKSVELELTDSRKLPEMRERLTKKPDNEKADDDCLS